MTAVSWHVVMSRLPRSAVAETKPRLAVLVVTRPRLQRRTALACETAISSAGRTFLTLAFPVDLGWDRAPDKSGYSWQARAV